MNELDPTYFGDTPIEGIKLFRKGKQSEPVTYHGKGDLLDVVAFVAQQRGYFTFNNSQDKALHKDLTGPMQRKWRRYLS